MKPEIFKQLTRGLKDFRTVLKNFYNFGKISNESYTRAVQRLDDMLEDLNSINK